MQKKVVSFAHRNAVCIMRCDCAGGKFARFYRFCGRGGTRREPEATVHDHNDRTWTELTADGGTLESGNYYLAGDVTLTTDITIADNATVTLCLNKHTSRLQKTNLMT